MLQDEVAEAIVVENGKTFTDAQGDVIRGLGMLLHCFSHW